MTNTTTALVDDVVAQAQAVRQLGEQLLARRHDPRTPAWLEREMKARNLPTGDTIPLKIYAGPPISGYTRKPRRGVSTSTTSSHRSTSSSSTSPNSPNPKAHQHSNAWPPPRRTGKQRARSGR